MEQDEQSHVLIYQVLGISQEEGKLIDVYQNKGRFLYKNMPVRSLKRRRSFASRRSFLTPVRFGFQIRTAKSQSSSEWIVWWAAMLWKSSGAMPPRMGDHITKEHTRMQAVRDAGYKPVRIMFYYPNRDQAMRIQKTLESLYKSVRGEYHYADAAWAYVKRRTGVDLLGTLIDLAAERRTQDGK
jgi:hypothetical protein